MNLQLEKKVVNSFTQRESAYEEDSADNGEYIFEIEQSLDGLSLLSSMSNSTLTLSNAEDLRTIAKVKAHESTINRIECSKVSPYLVVSASDDKTVRGWDTRCFDRPAFTMQHGNEVSAISVGLNGYLLASSCESTILFHDVRFFNGMGLSNDSPLLGSYVDVHSDIITQLKFHPTQSHILASASEDCLISTFDTSISTMEDSVISTFHTECPVARFNYFGENHDAIYALSTTETLSFWHHSSAQRMAEFKNIREQLGVDYLVDCFGPPASNDIYLLAGDYSGKGVVAQMLPTGFNVVSCLESGHSANIRCSSASFSSSRDVQVTTGGEDARLCRWTTQSSTPAAASPFQTAPAGQKSQTGPVRSMGGNLKVKKGNDLRFKPY